MYLSRGDAFFFFFFGFGVYCLYSSIFPVLVTAVAFVEGRFVEVDAVHITKELFLAPRGNKVSVSQLDYFCSSGKHKKCIMASITFMRITRLFLCKNSRNSDRWNETWSRIKCRAKRGPFQHQS